MYLVIDSQLNTGPECQAMVPGTVSSGVTYHTKLQSVPFSSGALLIYHTRPQYLSHAVSISTLGHINGI